MVLQGDDGGHEGRDGRRRGLPSEASRGRYATHCWALTRPLGRLGRHHLVSGGAIAQQWLCTWVQELREHLVGHHLLRRAREPRPQVLQQPFSGATTTSLTPPTLTLNATAGSKRAGSTTQQQDLAHSNHTWADHGGMAQNELT